MYKMCVFLGLLRFLIFNPLMATHLSLTPISKHTIMPARKLLIDLAPSAHGTFGLGFLGGVEIEHIVLLDRARIHYCERFGEYQNVKVSTHLLHSIYTSPQSARLMFGSSSLFGGHGLRLLKDGQVKLRSLFAFDVFVRAFQSVGAHVFIDFDCNGEGHWIELCAHNSVVIAGLSSYKAIVRLRLVFEESTKLEDVVFERGTKEWWCVFGPNPSLGLESQLVSNPLFQKTSRAQETLTPSKFQSQIVQAFMNWEKDDLSFLKSINLQPSQSAVLH